MKKKLMKNLLLVLVMTVLCLAVGMTASAETWGDYEYTVLGDGTVEITAYNGNATELEIPSKIDGRMVTHLAEHSFSSCHSLTNVAVPDSVTSIGSYAFQQCKNLAKVEIGNGVTTIGTRAFSDCKALSDISIGEKVTIIESEAFYFCDNLKNITVDKNNTSYSTDEHGVLFDKEKTVLLKYPAGKTDTSYTIPDSVITIGPSAFARCFYITNIFFPDSLVTIKEFAFDWCLGLTNLTIPDTVKNIELGAFCDLFFLEKVFFKNSCVNLSEGLFTFSEGSYFSGISYEDFLHLWNLYVTAGDENAVEELN